MNVVVLLTIAFLLGQTGDPPPAKREVNSDLPPASKAVLADLVYRVENELINDAVAGSLGLTVSMEDQLVVVQGEVSSPALRTRVGRLLERAADRDLKRVVNRVRIKEEVAEPGKSDPKVVDHASAPDRAQLERVNALLREKAPRVADSVLASFRAEPMPCIVLEGAVDTMQDKIAIGRIIRASFKALPLLNNIVTRTTPSMPRPQPAAAPPAPAPNLAASVGNKAVAIDSLTSQDYAPAAAQIADGLLKDGNIWDAAILMRVDGGVVWMRGVVKSVAHKARCVNHAETQSGVRSVVDEILVAPPAQSPPPSGNGAANAGAANTPPGGKNAGGLTIDEAFVYLKRRIRETLPSIDVLTVTRGDGALNVVVKDSLLSPTELKHYGETIERLGAELGVRTVVQIQ